MTVTIVAGAQGGDEGRGRVVDYLAVQADMVLRFQGDDDAGHTFVNDRRRFALHVIPCGIFYPHVRSVPGSGVVVNLDTVMAEQGDLQAAVVDTSDLWSDIPAHLIWPYHRLLDGVLRKTAADKVAGSAKRWAQPAGASARSMLASART